MKRVYGVRLKKRSDILLPLFDCFKWLTPVILFSTLIFNTANAETYRASLSQKYVWKTKAIPVCWENPGSINQKERSWVQDSITTTWQQYSDLSFEGWDSCSENSKGIRIGIQDTEPHTKGLGTQLDGQKNGMVLNFTYQNWSNSCGKMLEYCTRVIAIHEFGHALSFAHEQNRGDTPAWCDEPQGSNGDINIGAWDVHSVMNYCNSKWSNEGILSSTDIEALQQIYGKPPLTKGFFVELKTNFGRKELVFEEGENAEFLVRLNKPGYFYVVGHSKNKNEEVEYLFDFSETRNKPLFIHQVTTTETGKWISLGTFNVSQPFGFETIRAYASPNPISDLPTTRYNNETGLHALTESISRGFGLSAKYEKKGDQLVQTVLMIETRLKDDEEDE